jgi:hypothetical protein
MSELRKALHEYLAVRRALGFKLEKQGRLKDAACRWRKSTKFCNKFANPRTASRRLAHHAGCPCGESIAQRTARSRVIPWGAPRIHGELLQVRRGYF